MSFLDGMLGGSPQTPAPSQAPVGGAAPQAPPVSGLPPQPDYQKMMLAQALMGGAGGGAPANSFAGGLAQGVSPMMHMMMAQKMGLIPSTPSAAPPPTSPGMFQNAPPTTV